jgi:prepilin-type N-terminal cleavage/methylation domain-containing protein
MKRKKGVTLVELLVTIVIFSVVMVGVVMFNAQNSRTIVKSERNARKVLLQERSVEEFKGWLRSSAVPGGRFDSLWNYSSVGQLLRADTDSVGGITARLVIAEFLPDSLAGIAQTGVYLRVNVITTDSRLNTTDTAIALISRHD